MIRAFEYRDLDEIRGIAERWPQHFTHEGIGALLCDAMRLEARVAVEDERVVGVVVWLTTCFEAELLWLACDPNFARRGIGTSLIEAVLSTLSSQSIVYAKTASEASRRAGTRLDGAAFKPVRALFGSLGFRLSGILTAFWGQDEDAEVYIRFVRSAENND